MSPLLTSRGALLVSVFMSAIPKLCLAILKNMDWTLIFPVLLYFKCQPYLAPPIGVLSMRLNCIIMSPFVSMSRKDTFYTDFFGFFYMSSFPTPRGHLGVHLNDIDSVLMRMSDSRKLLILHQYRSFFIVFTVFSALVGFSL